MGASKQVTLSGNGSPPKVFFTKYMQLIHHNRMAYLNAIIELQWKVRELSYMPSIYPLPVGSYHQLYNLHP
jgi:hypothetical protein